MPIKNPSSLKFPSKAYNINLKLSSPLLIELYIYLNYKNDYNVNYSFHEGEYILDSCV
jgi:hypothetical protein